MLTNHLLYRLLIINACLIALVIFGLTTGKVQDIVMSDTTRVPFLMLALFLYAFALTAYRASKVSAGLNTIKAGKSYETSKLMIKNAPVERAAFYIVLLSLIGNSIGFYDAIHGQSLSGGSEAALKVFAVMTDGVAVALANVIIGLSLALWTYINFGVLTTATRLLEVDAAK